MLDLFTIFSKGGLVLWCFQETGHSFTSSVNALIKSVILQERGGGNLSFSHDALTLKYQLDNEFELVFVVAYQKILQLSYVDKFLSDIQLEFRNKYKDDLQGGKISRDFTDFSDVFKLKLLAAEEEAKQEAKAPTSMKTFEDSKKSQKTVSSMIIENKGKAPATKNRGKKKNKSVSDVEFCARPSQPVVESSRSNLTVIDGAVEEGSSDENLSASEILKNREKFLKKATAIKVAPKPEKVPEIKKHQKSATLWELKGTESKTLDFSKKEDQHKSGGDNGDVLNDEDLQQVGKMKGNIRDMEAESSGEGEESESDSAPEDTRSPQRGLKGGVGLTNGKDKSNGKTGGFWSGLRNLVGSKTLTKDDIGPVLEKMKDHLIGKNVAADIAVQLCESIVTKLEGKVLGTFSTVTSTVKQSLEETCVRILSPERRVDILRDSMDAKHRKRPYTIAFCGVNGVGKSTNLAKVTFWLIENGFRVLIAACDTFRAGAVEQLRTHVRKLNVLHPASKYGGLARVELYERGYGKDAAGIAMEAINYARNQSIDVVLIDTAGRMQDNEPLMKALAKLIKVNLPDLVLFVGEALVGNEAVDQLVKFNQALADHSMMDKPRLIDGILLTKFDTIDDKVGAAISMAYTTGQPIVFVGTGQTYTDLKNLNAKAVVNALLKA